jgi:hypothetical protein
MKIARAGHAMKEKNRSALQITGFCIGKGTPVGEGYR